MARIRTIKPEFFLSETLAGVSLAAERSFSGLWTQADDHGRLRDVPAVLNGALWPMRPEHTTSDMEEDLAALAGKGVVCRYEVAGRRFMHLPTWTEHQKIAKPSRSKVPPCPTHEGNLVAAAAAHSEGQLALEGDTPGKSSPQGRKEGPVAASGSAADFHIEVGTGRDQGVVSHVTRLPDPFSGAPEGVDGPDWAPEPESGLPGADSGAFAQVSGLQGAPVSHVTRPSDRPAREGDPLRGVSEAAVQAEEGPEGAFVQVSGLPGASVSRVTRIPDFPAEERKGTGKGKERRPSTLRVLDACARDANATLTDQPAPGSACGGQPATSSPSGQQVADISSEQTLHADSVGEAAADAAGALTQEEQMSADPNQDGLFEVPEGAQPAKAEEKPKRKANSAMTEERKAVAKAILNPWWKMYASKEKGGWGQSYGVVYSVLCSALKNGMTEDQIKEALKILGPEKTPISGGTIQFALRKHKKSAEAAVAAQAARRNASTFTHEW